MCHLCIRPEALQVVVTIAIITSFLNNSLGVVLAFPGNRENRGGGAEDREAAQWPKPSRTGRWEPRRAQGRGRERT